MKTLEDWKTAYYEQQALHTEGLGMLCRERDAQRERAVSLKAALEDIAAKDGYTIIGPEDGGSFEAGAASAFGECAAIAKAALQLAQEP